MGEMIALYCKKRHGGKHGLCPECQALLDYARSRSDKCPFMETKTFCSNCPVHCYKPEMREKIRQVMALRRAQDALCPPGGGDPPCDRDKTRTEKIGEETKMKRVLWIVLGCIGVGLGAVGAVLPLLPAFPFLLLAAFSFAKSSERLHTWFIHTKLYQNNLESYVTHRAMTMRTKRRVMATVTLLMAFGFTLMFLKGLYLPCGILAGVWVFHILYFLFGVKTLEDPAA